MTFQFIPKEFRRKFKAKSEVERLNWLVRVLEIYFERPISPALLTAENMEVFTVVTSWVRRAATYTRAVGILIRDDAAEAVIPIERALVEIWAEFLYLMEQGDPHDNANRVQITAILELRDYLLRKGEDLSAPESAGVARQLAQIQRDHPTVLAQIETARKSRKFHWSGLSRTKLGEASMGPRFREMYGLLSWDAHPVMTSVRDYDVDAAAGTILFEPLESGEELAESLAFRVGGCMFYMWDRYATIFGLPSLFMLSNSLLRRDA